MLSPTDIFLKDGLTYSYLLCGQVDTPHHRVEETPDLDLFLEMYWKRSNKGPMVRYPFLNPSRNDRCPR